MEKQLGRFDLWHAGSGRAEVLTKDYDEPPVAEGYLAVLPKIKRKNDEISCNIFIHKLFMDWQ